MHRKFQKIGDRLRLLKEDIDVYVSYADTPDRYRSRSHFRNFLTLFFGRNCFRYIFYFRLGNHARVLRFFFPTPYDSTTIECPHSELEGGGLFLSHAFGTILNVDHIGKGCCFCQNTTFGNLYKDGRWQRPYVGRNVMVGANVVVLGGVHVGDNVRIGAGSVVTKDIPDNCTVVGNPARIIRKDGIKVDILL